MLNRTCKDDLPALVTKHTKRSTRIDKNEDSAAVIIRRNSLDSKASSSTTSSTTEPAVSTEATGKLPYVEVYQGQKKAKNPYLCVACNKKFAKSSLNSHVKAKHRSKATKVQCSLCDQVFDKHTKAQDHVASKHQVYSCFKCASVAFSEFDKLKAHLKNSHNQDWPWICGFCDLILFYDLEFEVHIKQHTDKPPFACPLCSRLFSDNARLREHLARQHLPSEATAKENVKDDDNVDKNSSFDLTTTNLEPQQRPPRDVGKKAKSKQHQAEWQAQQIEAYERLTKRNMSVDKRPPATASLASMPKDEAAVSRELAALLLNLHDSNGSARSHVSTKSTVSSTDFNKAEDLSLKSTVETAIDLTKAKPEITLTPTMPASITKLVKGSSQNASSFSTSATAAASTTSSGVTVTKTSVKAPSYPTSQAAISNIPASTANGYAASAAAYPFYPSLASMASLSPTLAMNSNYLLQNLLLGKFQQIAANSGSSGSKDGSSGLTTSSTANGSANAGSASNVSSSMALPTHPLPAQTLSLPASKPPASVLKTATSTPVSVSSNGGNYNLQLLSESSINTSSNPASSVAASAASVAASTGAGANSIDIPYMCRQIVTLLNGLLFHQHNLNNPSVELNVHTQLGAIYQRLQEVVVMVEQAKKQQEATVNLLKSSAAAAVAASNHVKSDTDSKTEEKIAKHIHEYQRALLKQHEDNNKEAVASATSAAAEYLKKQPQVNGAGNGIEAVIQHQVDVVDSHGEESSNEANSAAAAAAAAVALKNRRRGRPPKNSNLDLSYSPPEKKLKSDLQPQPSHQQPESSSNAASNHHGLKYNGAEAGGQGQPNSLSASGSAMQPTSQQTNKGGKGIRNRVFCGECTGCLKNDDCGKCRYCKDKTKFGGQNRLRQKCLHRRCQLDTHRRRSSQNTNSHHTNHHHHSNGNSNNNSFTDVVSSNTIARQSPSPDAIYSGVALARLASQQHKSLVIDTAAAVEAMASEAAKKHNGGSQLSPGEIIRNAGQPAFPQAQQMPASEVTEDGVSRGSKSGESQPLPRAQQRSGSSASNASDEDNEDHKSGGRSQSRIDKWKAKHEAMLKMASNDKKSKGESDRRHSKNNSASSEDEQEASANATSNGLKTNGVCQLGLPKQASVPTALSVQ